MGHDISQATGQKLDARRASGRLCSGGRNHCTARATVYVVTTEDTAGKTYGPMRMCAGHAARFPVGYAFANPSAVVRHVPMPNVDIMTPRARQHAAWSAAGQPAHGFIPDSLPSPHTCAVCGKERGASAQHPLPSPVPATERSA